MTVNVNSHVYPLWHRPILVEMQNQYLYKTGNDGHLAKVYGMSSGDPNKDLEFMEDYTTVSRVPVGLVILYSKGIPFLFSSMKDMVWVYETLKKHIEYWTIEIRKPFGKKPPIDDLLKMDDFCEYLSLKTIDAIRERDILLSNSNTHPTTIDNIWTKFGSGFGRRKNLGVVREEEIVNEYYHSDLKTAINENSQWRETDGNS